MAITYHGYGASPADTGSQSEAAARAVTPPASMVAGDLVYVVALARTSASPPTNLINVNDGGQTWSAFTFQGTGGLYNKAFWCVYDGTWSADPTFNISGGASDGSAFSIIMLVYRPTSAYHTWSVDTAEARSNGAAPGSPYDVTITGQTPTLASSVTIATWMCYDDVLWTLQTAGWTVPSSIAQFRNQQAGDQTLAFAHKIQTSAAATGDVVSRQGANGPDQYSSKIVTFGETIQAPTFSGTVSNQTNQEDSAITAVDFSTFFSSGAAVASYSVQAGTLPTGLSLNTGTGVVTGTPTTAAVSSGLVIRATNAGGTADTGTFSWTITATSAATFSGTPTATGTTDGYDVDFTITGANGTVYGVVLAVGATTPTAAQIIAGTDASNAAATDHASKAATADVADTISFNGLSAATSFPLYKICLAVGTDVVAIASTQKSAPTGYAYVTVNVDGTETAASIVYGASPAVVDGDIILNPTTTVEGATLTLDVQGYATIGVGEGRQTFTVNIYDASVVGWMGDATFAVGNEAPTEILAIPDQTFYTGVEITPIRLDGTHVDDAENDEISYVPNVALPTGLSIATVVDASGPYEQIEGTPGTGTEGTTSHILTGTDEFGDTVVMTSFDITIVTGTVWPTLEGLSQAAAVDAVDAAGLSAEIGVINNGLVPRGYVDSQDPAPGTPAAVYSQGVIYIEGDEAPDVDGLTILAGTLAFQAIGVTVVTSAVYSSSIASGLIFGQSETAGTILIPGDEVTLIYSIGGASSVTFDSRKPRITFR